jgi:hypothetical protein
VSGIFILSSPVTLFRFAVASNRKMKMPHVAPWLFLWKLQAKSERSFLDPENRLYVFLMQVSENSCIQDPWGLA